MLLQLEKIYLSVLIIDMSIRGIKNMSVCIIFFFYVL